MKPTHGFYSSCLLFLAVFVEIVQPTCVLESDFGFKINCAFKKSGLFRVRNLGGVKAHASIGFSLGDELGFEQSLTNLDQSRRRSVSVKNGAPLNFIGDSSVRPAVKQEKRGKQNRIMMRPMAPATRPNQAAMDRLSSLHRRASSTMKPIIVSGPTVETTATLNRVNPTITMAKPLPMGVPPFKPLPPKEETLKVLPIASSTRKSYAPLQVPQSKEPGQLYQNPVPHQVHDLASMYPAYNTKKVDDYNTITGYGDDTTLKFNKEDINAKIAEIAKAGNISMEAVEAAIALRQQQLLNKYANLPVHQPTTTTTTTTSTTTTTEEPLVFQPEPEPEVVPTLPQKPKRNPTSGKVMNAPREYYPVGYEKNFDDHFQSKVDLPDTNFHCGDQKYFPGLYGDESLGCMVFHVCALTDDGLVMKSFLCPESTLFDQTILKCNWWFYVDCKNTRRLYDTNIPVSKSYQLMKALTFFSSYKKEMQEEGKPTNPEDVEGIKEAISILENQDGTKAVSPSNNAGAVQIVTPQPFVDERHNKKATNNETSPVYRANRNYNDTRRISSKRNSPSQINKSAETQRKTADAQINNSDFKLIKVNADINFDKQSSSTENISKATSSENSTERKHKRRMTLRSNSTSTTSKPSPVTVTTISPLVEAIKQEAVPNNAINSEVQPERLINQIQNPDVNLSTNADNYAPVKRFYRSSAESYKEDKEMALVNNEKVQIIRPTSMARLVGEHATSTVTIAKLDQAILGTPASIRVKKEAFTIVTPQRHESSRSPTNRYRT